MDAWRPSVAWPFVLLGLGLLGVGLSFWRPVPAGVWHDDGVYMLIGQALGHGQGLRYVGVPGSPPAVKFPPGYPLVLAVLWRALGDVGPVTLAAGLLNLVFVAGAGALFGWALHRGAGLGSATAVGVAALAFASADVWRYALVPLSEPMFIALAAGTLAAWVRAGRPGDRRGSALLAVLLVGAVLTRSAGVALVAGFAVALLVRRGPLVAAAVCAPALAAAVGWGAWASARAAEVPEGLRDVLGPYGGWLGGQLTRAPGAFLAAFPGQVRGVFERVFALLLPGATGWVLWVAAVPVAVLAAGGLLRLARTLPPVPWVVLTYLAMLLLWPFVDRRLVAPVHPWIVVAVCVGALEAGRRVTRDGARRVLGAAVFAWVGAYTVVSAARDARGWAVAGYRLRAGRLAAAVETLSKTAPPGAVVGAPEFWAALHLHGGWSVVPSARFTPRSEDETAPVWGTPLEQLALWWDAGVTHVLLEQGGIVHGAALDLLEKRCPGTVRILARMPPQMLVALGWDEACARTVGLVGADGPGTAARLPGADPSNRGPARSPLDAALLGRVDLLGVAVAQQHLLDLLVEEGARLRVARVEPVVVDEQRLVLEPFLPAVGTDLALDPLAQLVAEGRAGHARGVVPAPAAVDGLVSHVLSLRRMLPEPAPRSGPLPSCGAGGPNACRSARPSRLHGV